METAVHIASAFMRMAVKEHFQEMRCRVVLELVHNKQCYLDAHLWGMNQASLQMIASLSDDYSSDDTAQGSPRAHLHVVGMLRFMSLT